MWITTAMSNAAATAAEFLGFPRQPKNPIAPRPDAKSGRAAGRGVAIIKGRIGETPDAGRKINAGEIW
jgi:hypothetical protein